MNKYLTPAMHRFLCAIRDSEDEYAIQEGLQVWVELTRFSAVTVANCLRLCLISEDSYSDGKTRIWSLNEDGEGVLKDADYVPGIVKAMAGKAKS